MNKDAPQIEVRDVTMAYGSFVVMRDINFTISPGEIFIIMGGSGCGKSTLLKHMIGLRNPAKGDILYHNQSFVSADDETRSKLLQRFGVAYQYGALWSSMTLAENVALPLQLYSNLSEKEIAEIVQLKLSLMGLRGFEEFYPSAVSGGMRKRASLARALALDPEILFFDEPASGLDPVSSRRLDELLLQLRQSLGTTVVVVTHDLDSILTIADNAVYLDTEVRTMSGLGDPVEMKENPPNENIRRFLNRTST